SDPDIVWVGTGVENARNSVQWGDGVYKSTDGGATFTHMGLRETFQIGHIAIHPTNPDIVYVAALGRLWGENEERGVYKTTDGGKNWQRVLFLDDKTGCIEVRVHPKDPDTVFACMFERKRPIFDDNDPSVRFGEKAGLYKSTDGGANWKELTNGLPSCQWGRSGIDLLGDSNTMFLIAESERSGWIAGDHKDRRPGDPVEETRGQGQGQQGQAPQRRRPGTALIGIPLEGEDGPEGSPGAMLGELTEGGALEQAGLKTGDRITKLGDAAVTGYEQMLEIVRASVGGDKVTVTYVRDDETSTVEITYGTRAPQGGQGGGGGGPNGPYGARLNGQVENKQHLQGELGYETGGIFRSDDRGESWTRINSLTERPFYYSVIRVDPQSDQNLYCVGTTLWGSSDGGKKFAGINRGIHVDFHTIWVDPDDEGHLLAGCDGGVNETFDGGKNWRVHKGFSVAQYYDVVADNSVPYNVVGGLQDNGTWVGPSRSRNREGITAADWVTIYGGDGFGAQTDPVEPWIVFATSQNGAMGAVDMRTGGSMRVQRDRPEDGQARWNWDSPFILSPHNRLTVYHAGSHVFRGERYAHLDNSAARSGQDAVNNRGTMRMRCISKDLGATKEGTAVSIAESPRVQGLLYVGTDDGALWRTEDGGVNWARIDNNLPIVAPRYVSDIVPSYAADDRVYLTLDGHRFDDFSTYVFVSEDRGNTWHSLGIDLPTQEPCYAVMEDPRNENLLFLGTEYGCHVSLDRGQQWFPLGRGLPTVAVRDLFVQDRDSDLVIATHGRGVWVLDIEALRQTTADVAKAPAHLFAVEPAILWRMTSRGLQGHADHKAENPPYGATFHVWLAETPKEAPVLTVHDLTGKEIAKVTGKAQAGLQAVNWDARVERRLAAPGSYSVRLAGHGDLGAQPFELLPDPAAAPAAEPTNPLTDRE
ncbi:MAG: PDZ domain-containing protein, partial [Planctomycetes bacterium]|nr:PDZ domain-containing protein [Planctomycetota bacterium]